ncbi:MAG: signal peptidase I [Patescibacteria group bacterium]
MPRSLKLTLKLVIYFAVVGGLIFGLPRFLSWSLATPYPLAAVTSGSMWPVLNEGDLVFIKGSLKLDDLKIGDVIVWRGLDGRGFTIHRITKMEGEKIITKGDANFNPDDPIAFDQVVGRALTWKERLVHIPYLGSVTVLASNWKK